MEKRCSKCNINFKILIPAVAIIIIVTIIIIGSIKIIRSNNYEKYLQNGDYETAYEKCNKNKRNEIIKENAVAYAFNFLLGDEQIMASPKLISAWCDEEKNVVLYFSSTSTKNNSYVYATFNKEQKKYVFECVTGDPINANNIIFGSDEANNSSYFNIIADTIINYINNIKKTENKLDNGSIENINSLFEAKKLKDVIMLDK